MKTLAFFIVGLTVLLSIFRGGSGKHPLDQARESAMRKVALAPVIADAEATITAKWEELCRRHGFLLDSDTSVIKALDADRAELVYAVCAVWRDSDVIDELAKRLPFVFTGWQST